MLFVGDDWAEAHHNVEVQDDAGPRLVTRRLPEGVAGMAALHALKRAILVRNQRDSDQGRYSRHFRRIFRRYPWRAGLGRTQSDTSTSQGRYPWSRDTDPGLRFG
jgi:hypothetical protein